MEKRRVDYIDLFRGKETINQRDLGYLKGRERCESPYDRQFDSATEIVQ